MWMTDFSDRSMWMTEFSVTYMLKKQHHYEENEGGHFPD
jgi:hypothetical protein